MHVSICTRAPPGHPATQHHQQQEEVLATSPSLSLGPAMSSQQQQKRIAAQQGVEHANGGAKRSRTLAIPDGAVKQEPRGQGGEEAGQGAEGKEGALVPVVQAMEEPQINVWLSVTHLHCHACVLPLKPPTFQCEAGHALCRACRGSHVLTCAGAGTGTYVPCTLLDKIVRDAKVRCAYEAYGCASWVVYYESPEHHGSCRFAPCFCPVPGCGHFTSPARLTDHFLAHHAWPVTEVDYARTCKLTVPGPQDKLVLVGNADGSVFLVSQCALDATAVSLVCVRACGDAAAGAPQYTCKLWVEVAGNTALVTSVVSSSDLADGFPATDKVMFLAVPQLLHGDSGEPPALMVRIDKVGASAGWSRSPSATPPSSLPRRMLQRW